MFYYVFVLIFFCFSLHLNVVGHDNFLSYQSIRINQEHPKNGILTEVQFSDRAEALRNKTKKAKEILPFINTKNPATPNIKVNLLTPIFFALK